MRSSLALAIVISSASFAMGDVKPIEIPLKSIWALDMPGTRDISELADGPVEKSLVEPLLKHLQDTWKSEIGWAVQGEGLEALQQFYIAEMGYGGRKPAPTGFPEIKRGRVYADSPVSLVLFTQQSDYYVHLQSVEKEGNQYWIRYQFVPHKIKESGQHLALIPLGELPPGMYGARMERAPMDKKYLDAGFSEPPHEQMFKVCGSFGFEVADREAAAVAARSMTVPLKDIWAYRMPGPRDMNELDGGKAQKTLVEPLLKHIRETWNNDPGAAVQGEGLAALQQYYRIEVEGQEKGVLSAAAPISLVFFTKPTGGYIHLQSVVKECNSNRFTIFYRFVPHESRESTQHMALIPLGKVHPGKYVVKMKRLPMEDKYREIGFPEPSREHESNMCKSFIFVVIGSVRQVAHIGLGWSLAW